MAIDFTNWIDPDDDAHPMETWDTCQRHGVQELLLVVGNTKAMEDERDVIFVSPAERPFETYVFMNEALGIPMNAGLEILEAAIDDSWEGLAKRLLQKAEDSKLERAQERQEYIDGAYSL